MNGPPTIQQLARDLWLADISFLTACGQLHLTAQPQKAAVFVIYQSLSCLEAESERLSRGKVS